MRTTPQTTTQSSSAKNIVIIGGGTGLSSMMAGLKELEGVNLTAVITVADDGGSTGRIRDVYNIPAMGDIRHVLCAMGETEDSLFGELMNYRFSGSEDIGGHQLGNLIFLALMDITGSFIGAIQAISRVLKVQGTILPSTLENVRLYARLEDGSLVKGEKNIPNHPGRIREVLYQKPIYPYAKAVDAISKADMILYGTGSLYTSILPNIVIGGIREAIQANPCPKIYFCNAMTQPGETDGYSVEDHVRALQRHMPDIPMDAVIVNNEPLDERTTLRYAQETSEPVQIMEQEHDYLLLERPLIKLDETGRIRHNPEAVLQVVKELLERFSNVPAGDSME